MTTDLLVLDDSRLEDLKVTLPSPETSQFKLSAIDFEKVHMLSSDKCIYVC